MILHRDRSTHSPRFFPGNCGCLCTTSTPVYYYSTPRITTSCCSVSFPSTLTATMRVTTGTCSNFGGPHTSTLVWGDSAISLPVCAGSPARSQGGWTGTFTTSDGNSWDGGLFCLTLSPGNFAFRYYLRCAGSGVWCISPYQVSVPSGSNPCNSPIFISFGFATVTPLLCGFQTTCGGLARAYCGGDSAVTVEVTE